MIRTYLLLFLWLLGQVSFAFGKSERDSLIAELSQAIHNKTTYDKAKLDRIDQVRSLLKETDLPLTTRFQLYRKLVNEYGTFTYDSAYKYAVKLNEVATQLHEPVKRNESKLKLTFTLLTTGFYKEALDSLNSIKPAQLPDSLKIAYYTLKSRSYYELGAYNADGYYWALYNEKGNVCADSAMHLLSKQTSPYYFLRGIKELKEKKFEEAKRDFRYILTRFRLSPKDYAITASSLASVYIESGQSDQAIDLMIKAAIADVKSSTKEGLALAYVADLLYKEGYKDKAFYYIRAALDDATFYGAKLRLKHVSSILPVIEEDRMITIESQKNRLLVLSVIISILFLFVIAFAYIIYKQYKQLNKVQKTVIDTNHHLTVAIQQLKESNGQLQEKNDELLEAHRIKEEYIGYSFNMYSQYLDKLETIKKAVDRKISNKSYDAIGQVLNAFDTSKEREALYLSFDKTFMKLFPHFITAFNSFFKKEDQYIVKDDQPLPIDLRVFALIRLGISDHEQIAKILEYSVRTIYNTKTKVKNKSLLSNEEFERNVMAIKAF